MKLLSYLLMFTFGVVLGVSQYSTPHTPKPLADACYWNKGEQVSPEFNGTTTIVEIHWTSESELRKQGVSGYSNYQFIDASTTACAIYAPIPTHVYGDHKMDTLGHELLHCLIGSYHE